jgi:hypothetical protein
MTEKPQVVQLTAQQVVDEINRRGAEIVRLQRENAQLWAACKIALPFLKHRDSADALRAALRLAKGESHD